MTFSSQQYKIQSQPEGGRMGPFRLHIQIFTFYTTTFGFSTILEFIQIFNIKTVPSFLAMTGTITQLFAEWYRNKRCDSGGQLHNLAQGQQRITVILWLNWGEYCPEIDTGTDRFGGWTDRFGWTFSFRWRIVAIKLDVAFCDCHCCLKMSVKGCIQVNSQGVDHVECCKLAHLASFLCCNSRRGCKAQNIFPELYSASLGCKWNSPRETHFYNI